MLGPTLGPYQLLEELGSGGMAAVYRAHQANMGRDVAVKVIYQELADEVGREQFQREARLIARLEHPHILPVYDFDGQSNPPYIVMRYLPGGTLKESLPTTLAEANTSTRWRNCLRWLHQLADALDYAHRQGIVHRDLKPSNIILDSENNLFLADFGIALPAHESAAAQELLGTPLYAAPEQLSGVGPLGPATDLYALGVIAYELFTLALPFNADDFEALVAQITQAPPPAVQHPNPGLPATLNDVFARALAKTPAARYPTAAALVDALSLALGITYTRSLSTEADAHLPETPTEQNKIVTALCVDAAAYAGWLAEGRPEAPARVLPMLWAALDSQLTQHQGLVVEQRQEQLLAIWGAATASETDAEQAVRAALAVLALPLPIPPQAEEAPALVGVGVHTGLALLKRLNTEGPPTYAADGPATTLAQRLAESAEGQALISADTARLVLGAFDIEADVPLKVRGRKTPLSTYRVKQAKPRVFHFAPRTFEGIEIRLVGRDAEYRQLQRAFLAAQEEQETQAITVLGEAGLGKSRLLAELIQWVDLRPETVWLFTGRATPAMTQRPYALLRDMFSTRFEILDDDPVAVVQQKLEAGVSLLLEAPDAETAHFIGHLAGFDLAQSPHLVGLRGDAKQLTARARQLCFRFFARLSTHTPTLLTLEDLHYADEASLTLFNDLLAQHPNCQLFLLALARPTLLERAPTWGGGKENFYRATGTHRLLALAPLDKRDSRELVQELLQKITEPPKALRDLLVERAEGNPLFMEELIKMLFEDRVLLKDNAEVWRVESSRLAHLRVPPTLVGVLQARLDTLLYPEKLTLQRAAVIGRVFVAAALEALDAVDEAHVDNVQHCLAALVARDFIRRRETASFTGSAEYVFTQAMTRDLVYDTLLARQQQAYHTAFATWLASTERAAEYLPLIAEHYEKAGDTDRAALYLERAGDHAQALSAYPDALKFYQRALAYLPPAAQVAVQLQLAEIHYRLADFAAAQAMLAQLAPTASPAETAAAQTLQGEMLVSKGEYAAAHALLTATLPGARAGNNPLGLARTLAALGNVTVRLGQLAESQAYLEESLALARAQADLTRQLFAMSLLGTVFGMQGQQTAKEQILQEALKLALQAGNRERAMTVLNNLGVVMDDRGDTARAVTYAHQALTLAREIGAQQQIALSLINLADGGIKLGQLAEARAHLREGLTLAQQLGTLPLVLAALMYFAKLAAAENDLPQAITLFGLAQSHPAFSSAHRREMDTQLAAWQVSPEQQATYFAQGAALNLEQTLAQFLAD